MFRAHSVSQRPNLRHLGEPLGGAKSPLEAVSFKKATEGMGRGRVANARWERVPHSGGCNTETTGGKCSVNTSCTRLHTHSCFNDEYGCNTPVEGPGLPRLSGKAALTLTLMR